MYDIGLQLLGVRDDWHVQHYSDWLVYYFFPFLSSQAAC